MFTLKNVDPKTVVQFALETYPSGSIIRVADIFPAQVWENSTLFEREKFGTKFKSYVKSMNSNLITRYGTKNSAATYRIG